LLVVDHRLRRRSADACARRVRARRLPVAGDDIPDEQTRVSDCDGVDGTIDRAVFVAADGDDSAMGTREAPVRTIRQALRLASYNGRSQVLVGVGTYNESETLVIPEGIGVFGGYERARAWARGGGQSEFRGASTAIVARAMRLDGASRSAGQGGGGGGGPSVGVWTVDATAMTSGVSYELGSAGNGGAGGAMVMGLRGSDGVRAETHR